ncbi:MAG: LuxR C-terminal-related transcriptional regulator [Citrobacter sp.]|uniref:Helix-turn-helix transcriptional regulator n=1 Tax=Citrobacter tructae TaxID=2562449 RepID=A0ABX5T955_9ENTR|nr:LuxR C-terminal-related transcriptional regulator [Citrobacter tructae]QBX82028.1 helix-turn-helix transcriptional regulator [Citrobacter tructae]
MLNMDSKIILISNQSIQTQLLLDYLNKKSDTLVDFINISRPDMSFIAEGSIILYDIQASSRKLKKVWSRLLNDSHCSMRIFIINCLRAFSLYENMSWPHFECVVPNNCTTEHLLNVIKTGGQTPRSEHSHSSLKEKVSPIQPENEAEQRLTEREYEVLVELSRGASNMEIAHAFFISENTVRTHIYNIFKKISVSNRTQAACWANAHLRAPALGELSWT